MDEITITQLTVFSIAMSYLWLLVVIMLAVVIVLRRRRMMRLEMNYLRQHPPMPYMMFRHSIETQENPAIISSVREVTRRLRHINPSDQVAIEIKPDSDQLVPSRVQAQSNLHKLYASLSRANSASSD